MNKNKQLVDLNQVDFNVRPMANVSSFSEELQCGFNDWRIQIHHFESPISDIKSLLLTDILINDRKLEIST